MDHEEVRAELWNRISQTLKPQWHLLTLGRQIHTLIKMSRSSSRELFTLRLCSCQALKSKALLIIPTCRLKLMRINLISYTIQEVGCTKFKCKPWLLKKQFIVNGWWRSPKSRANKKFTAQVIWLPKQQTHRFWSKETIRRRSRRLLTLWL